MRIKWFAALPLACALSLAQGADGGADKPAAKPASDDLVCTYETPVGSHLKKRICQTRTQREERAARDQQRLGSMRDRGSRPTDRSPR